MGDIDKSQTPKIDIVQRITESGGYVMLPVVCYSTWVLVLPGAARDVLLWAMRQTIGWQVLSSADRDTRFSLAKITKETGLHRNSIAPALALLEKLNLLKLEHVGGPQSSFFIALDLDRLLDPTVSTSQIEDAQKLCKPDLHKECASQPPKVQKKCASSPAPNNVLKHTKDIVDSHPLTAAAVRQHFPEADDQIIARIVEAARSERPSVTDDEIACAVTDTHTRDQYSAGRWLTTVPQYLRGGRRRRRRPERTATSSRDRSGQRSIDDGSAEADYNEYCQTETDRFFAGLPEGEYQRLFDKNFEQSRTTFGKRPAEDLRQLTHSAVMLELEQTGRLKLMSFGEFAAMAERSYEAA